MAGIDNIPDFFDGEKPNAEKFNLLRDAILQQFTGGIVSTSLQWPLVAYGTLDMNNNPITNIGSLNNVTHVNSSKSLTEAVNEVNASGGNAVITIDPDFVATTSAVGVTITTPNVTIMGQGAAASISLDGTVVGIKSTADGFQLRNLRLAGNTSPIGVLLEGGRFDVRMCLFEDVAIGLKLGSGSNPAHGGFAIYNTFDVAGTGIVIGNSFGSDVDNNVFNECEDDMIFLDASNEFLQDLSISGNVGFSSASMANGHGIRGNITAVTAKKSGLIIQGNLLSCATVSAKVFDVGQMQSVMASGNHFLDGEIFVEGTNNIFENNTIAAAAVMVFDRDRTNCALKNNAFIGGILIGTPPTVDKFCVIADNSFSQNVAIDSGVKLALFKGNRVTGSITGLLSATLIRMYYGNDATGTVT